MSASTEVASFAAACATRSLGDGTFIADLRQEWSIGAHPHGGFLMALLARAGISRLTERGDPPADPLALSVDFLRAPAIGPVLLRVDVRKLGRRATVIDVVLEQRGRSCVEGRLTVGRLPTHRPVWTDTAAQPAEPVPGAVPLAGVTAEGVFHLAKGCDVRVDPATAGYLVGRTGDPPAMRLWVRPKGAPPDPLFALFAGDINPPVVFNAGRFGWAPTVQLTAYLRTHPAPGWLRVQVASRSLQEPWFDSDATVIDSTGRIVCQARQLALAPAP